MTKVKVLVDGRVLEVEKGSRLSDVLAKEGLIQLPCGGRGLCGSCVVEVKGPVSEPTGNEILRGLGGKYRLACQVRVLGDIEVKVLAKGAPKVSSYSLTVPVRKQDKIVKLHPVSEPPMSTYPHILLPEAIQALSRLNWEGIILSVDGLGGVTAVPVASEVRLLLLDLGTTKIAYEVLNLRGDVVREGYLLNPQGVYGADVMTRLGKAMDDKEILRHLRNSVIKAVDELFSSNGCSLCLLAGNSAMESIFLGLPLEQLGLSPYQPFLKGPFLTYIHRRPCIVSPMIGGHVGGDAFMDLVAAEELSPPLPYMIVDVGTNTEIVLVMEGDEGKNVYTASAPAGPAFEGHLTSGSPAAIGGFTEVRIEGLNDEGMPIFSTSGEGPGLTGYGVVSLVSELLRWRLVDGSGKFLKGYVKTDLGKAFIVDDKGRQPTLFTQKDMREFQKALSAVRTAWELTLRKAGISPELLKEIFIAGNFGVGLRLEAALQLEVVPPVNPEKVVIGGNMVVAGLRVSALNWSRFNEVWAMAEKAKHVELAEEPDFNEVWVRNLSISLKK
jgi:uncharacterized 2Fe-2S/4Fe-4S cluster protein (DUF4445 family)